MNCFGLGAVKFINTALGVRDVGLFFIKRILVYEESGAGPMTDIKNPVNE